MAASMRAVVLSAPGPVENLQIRQLPLPEPEPGWVRIKVEAFGLNRSELHTRLGLAEGVTFPRVLGIECVDVLGAIPETLQTAYGSLTTGLDLKAGETLLIRGGTSALGLVAAALGTDRGATVLSTTRRAERTQALSEHGVHYALVDTGQIAPDVRQIVPGGVDAALE